MSEKVKKLVTKKDVAEKVPNEFVTYMINEINKNKEEQKKLIEYLKQITQEHAKVQSQIASIVSINTTYEKDIKFWLEKDK